MERLTGEGHVEALDKVREMIGRGVETMDGSLLEIRGVKKVDGRHRVVIKYDFVPLALTKSGRKGLHYLLPKTVISRFGSGEWTLSPERNN